MPSPITTATLQAAALTLVSNLLAQILKAHNANEPVQIDWQTVFNIVLFAVISTPPNFLWQGQLETWFPSQVPVSPATSSAPPAPGEERDKVEEDEKQDNKAVEKAGGEGKVIKGGDMKLSVGNTAKKFFTDQLVGAPVNTVLYLAAMGWFKGFRGWEGVGGYVSEEFWPLTIAGLKVWPLVSLLCFAVIPAEQRIVFGSLVGLGWNIFLGLRN